VRDAARRVRADVIKVEQPRVGDDLRRLGRPVSPSAGGSYWWFVEARNKKSDHVQPERSRRAGADPPVVAGAHVVTENFRQDARALESRLGRALADPAVPS